MTLSTAPFSFLLSTVTASTNFFERQRILWWKSPLIYVWPAHRSKHEVYIKFIWLTPSWDAKISWEESLWKQNPWCSGVSQLERMQVLKSFFQERVGVLDECKGRVRWFLCCKSTIFHQVRRSIFPERDWGSLSPRRRSEEGIRNLDGTQYSGSVEIVMLELELHLVETQLLGVRTNEKTHSADLSRVNLSPIILSEEVMLKRSCTLEYAWRDRVRSSIRLQLHHNSCLGDQIWMALFPRGCKYALRYWRRPCEIYDLAMERRDPISSKLVQCCKGVFLKSRRTANLHSR